MAKAEIPADLSTRFESPRLFGFDSAFTFLRATQTLGKQPVILQIVQPTVPGIYRSPLRRYFRDLSDARNPGLLTPIEAYDKDGQLVYVYEDKEARPASEEIPADLDAFVQFCTRAGNALRALHVKGIMHGCPGPSAWFVIDGKVRLWLFGYAPLLQAKFADAAFLCGSEWAPEISGGTATTSSDCYAFARAIASWRPALARTDWFRKATSASPADRFTTVTDLLDALERALGIPLPTADPIPEIFSSPIPLPIPPPPTVPVAPSAGTSGHVEVDGLPEELPSPNPGPSFGTSVADPDPRSFAAPVIPTTNVPAVSAPDSGANTVAPKDWEVEPDDARPQNSPRFVPPTLKPIMFKPPQLTLSPAVIVVGVLGAMGVLGWLVIHLMSSIKLP